MNYFPFHLGDYSAHTAHLEPMEDLAYRRLLDQYYLREGPLPADTQVTAKLVRMRSCVADVESVLREFFTLTDDGWRHARCDEEIDRMQDKQAKARASAQASVSARRANAEKAAANAERSLAKEQTDVELPTPTPTPKRNTEDTSAEPTRTPSIPCPYAEIVAAYHSALPSLPKVKLQTKDRQSAMRKRWGWVLSSLKSDGTRRASNADEALSWLREFFTRASANDFLMGRTQRSAEHAGWQCDFDFLLTDKGLKQVVEKTQAEAA